MIILFFIYYIFSDDIIEESKNFEPIIKKIKFKYNLVLQNKKYKDKKIKQIEEKYEKLYKELESIKNQEQFIEFFNKYKNI